MKKRIVVHIGTHKTGTSAIQDALSRSRSALAAQGVLYARTDREPFPNLPKHCSLWRAANDADGRLAEEERRILIEELDACGAHTLVLSEEGLSEPLPRLARLFVPWMSRFDITVICMVRRQDLFLESLFSQFVREPGRRDPRVLSAFLQAAPVRDRLDYQRWLGHWQDTLRCKLVTLDFDATVRSEEGLLGRFTAAAGLPPLPVQAARVNATPDMRLALVVNQLNRLKLDYDIGQLSEASATLLAEGRLQPLKRLLGRDPRRRLLDAMVPSNLRLQQQFGVQFDASMPDEPAGMTELPDHAFMLEMLARLSTRTG